jgi:16S rRNA (guanine(966)-N(2))-methyltransferase RsmD
MDRMRESLFSILGPLDGFSFLDLFCGSGIMALEALSRGATRATLVERDRGKRTVITKNLELARETSCPEPRLVFAPVEVFVAREKARYDIIYLDPPFAYRHKADLLRRIVKAGLLAPEGYLLIHYPAGDDLPERIGDIARSDERRYGRSTVRFYAWPEPR